MQDHNAFPNIAKLTIEMVAANGGLHRLRAPSIGAERDVLNRLDECLGSDGVYYTDLEALNAWLGSLSEQDFDTVVDGEESEVAAILATAPTMADNEPASGFIDHIYENCI